MLENEETENLGIENLEIKPWIINFIIKKLNSCQPFIREYGKKFAERALDINLGKIYTNGANKKANASYNIKDGSMILYKAGKNGKKLTIEDILSSSNLQATILHEGAHAVFTRTKQECKKYGIEYGTGLQENYHNNTELGRGMNEGWTNWLLKKANVDVPGYESSVKCVELLELAVGEANIMKLGRR